MKRLHRRLPRLAAPLLALSLLAGTASATWSIVLVNRATGEVAVTSATCLPGANIKRLVPVIWVGVGAAAAQSAGDITGENRIIIRDGFFDRETPQAILDELRFGAGTQPNQRQYGIVSFDGPPVTFTGNQAGDAQIGLVGEVGDIAYAIQGNLLAGDAVVYATEAALLATEGDVGQKMIAAMEAGRDFGGDGRCSCNGNDADSCGSPPPDFEKSAHVMSFQIARIGDSNGGCNANGCAKGTYYTNLNFSGTFNNPDPVTRMRSLYENWRADRVGRPDHILSKVTPSATSLPADGVTQMEVTIECVDLDGVPLTTGGALVEVTAQTEAEGVSPVSIGPVTDHGDGTYSFPVTAGTEPGEVDLVITADDGFKVVTLYPFTKVRVDPAAPLHAGFDRISAFRGSRVPFVIDDDAGAGGFYILLGSHSGTVPGTPLDELFLPLNVDDLTYRTIRAAGGTYLPDSIGVLDPEGRALPVFTTPPGLLRNFIGQRMDWAAVIFDGGFRATNPVGFQVTY